MPRNYTRAQQRKYREERKRQAARVADRLMGRKKYIPLAHDDFMDALKYQFSTNMYVSNPRHNTIITGFNGV